MILKKSRAREMLPKLKESYACTCKVCEWAQDMWQVCYIARSRSTHDTANSAAMIAFFYC